MSGRWRDKLRVFLFPAEHDAWIAIFRIGLGLHLALYCFALRAEWTYFFLGTGRGILSRQLSEAVVSSESALIPRLGWLLAATNAVGIPEQAALLLVWMILLIAALCLAAGFLCRPAAIAAWFLHLCAAKSGGLLSYGVDNFMTIGLFYLMLVPLPDRYSLDRRLRGPRRFDPHLAGFSRRVLQLHLCLIYFFGGLTKSLGSGWWDGLNIWRALTRVPFNLISPDLIASFAPVLPVIGVSVWLIEIAYPFLIWSQRTRFLWLALTCAMHVAIGLAMGMYLFALVMIVLNAAAFGPDVVIQSNAPRRNGTESV